MRIGDSDQKNGYRFRQTGPDFPRNPQYLSRIGDRPHQPIVNLRILFAMAFSNWLAARCSTASRTGSWASDHSAGVTKSDLGYHRGMKQLVPTFIVPILLIAAACLSGDPVSTPATQPTTRTTASGLTIVEVKSGDGDVAGPGDTVSVHYTGKLKDGTKFDSSYDRNRPIQFVLGAHQVIPGWDEGITGMRVGEKRQLIIPPDLAYGANGTPDGTIPPNATLYFDVELMRVTHP